MVPMTLTPTTLTIVGAGSAGLRLAQKLGEKDIPVTVYEDHPEIGIPEHCSGLISARNTKELGFDLRKSFTNDIYGAKIFSPNNTQLRIEGKKPVAHVMDRSLFDQTLYQQALDAGAQIELSTSVINVKGNTLFTQSKGKGGMKKSDIIVAADGVNSRLRKIAGIESQPGHFIHSYQVKAAGHFDPKFVELYLGNKFAPHFFAWVIPENEESAKIGIGCKVGVNPAHAFNAFMKEKQIDVHVKSSNSFLIPCSKPLRQLVAPPIVLLGDAAYQTKATTGGGIIMNCKSADILAGVLHEHITNGTSLDEYPKRMEPIFKELEMHYKIHQYQSKLTDEQLNKFFLKIKDAGVEQFLSNEGDMDEPTRFIGKLLGNPRMISLLPEALSFAMTK
jgi:geranylgeranyl reductase family protein